MIKRAPDSLIVATKTGKDRWKWRKGFTEHKVRNEYDSGLIELAQSRDGNTIQQFRIPRKTVSMTGRPYFSRPSEDRQAIVGRAGK